MTLTYGRVESFHGDQLIVALPHLNILVNALNDIGARFEAVQRHNVYLRGDVYVEREGNRGTPPAKVKIGPFTGKAVWSGTSFAAAAVSGKLAAHTVPGVRSAREALNDLLQPGPGLLSNGIRFRVPGR
jgi:hypothetical protein